MEDLCIRQRELKEQKGIERPGKRIKQRRKEEERRERSKSPRPERAHGHQLIHPSRPEKGKQRASRTASPPKHSREIEPSDCIHHIPAATRPCQPPADPPSEPGSHSASTTTAMAAGEPATAGGACAQLRHASPTGAEPDTHAGMQRALARGGRMRETRANAPHGSRTRTHANNDALSYLQACLCRCT